MKLNNGHFLYKEADVLCSPPQLVLLLCDGTMRYLHEAVEHLRANRWAEKGKAVEAALECINELRRGLDHETGGETATQLDRMYGFLSAKLTYANAMRDPAQFEQIIDTIRPVRDAWQELFDRLKSEGKLADHREYQATLQR